MGAARPFRALSIASVGRPHGISASALAACRGSSGDADRTTALVKPSDLAVAAAEKKRTRTGRVHKLTLIAAPAMLELGDGVMAKSWAFGRQAPYKEPCRAPAGRCPADRHG
ncbi:hypothetical protein ACWDSL_27105 [Streptomyces sp. NPDC000941]